MPDAMLHPEFETLSAGGLRDFQNALWADQWSYTKASPFYQAKFGKLSGRDISLDGISDLPFTEKDYSGKARKTSSRSATTFDAVTTGSFASTRHRERPAGHCIWREQQSRRRPDRSRRRAIILRGRTPAWRQGDPLPQLLHVDRGLTDHLALEAAGACVVPYGEGGTAKLLETIEDLGVNAISCTPSYPALLKKSFAN